MAAAFVCATPALADDPRDSTMTPDAIARDRETIRRLNSAQIDYVQKRDAGYAQGWRDHAASGDARDYARRAKADDTWAEDSGTAARRDYAAARADYARERRRYERAMADWRQDVAACRAGDYDSCD